VPSEVQLGEEDGMKGPCAANLHNVVTASQQRLGKRLESVRKEHFQLSMFWRKLEG